MCRGVAYLGASDDEVLVSIPEDVDVDPSPGDEVDGQGDVCFRIPVRSRQPSAVRAFSRDRQEHSKLTSRQITLLVNTRLESGVHSAGLLIQGSAQR